MQKKKGKKNWNKDQLKIIYQDQFQKLPQVQRAHSLVFPTCGKKAMTLNSILQVTKLLKFPFITQIGTSQKVINIMQVT